MAVAQGGDDSEPPISGDALAGATQAAIAHTGGGTVTDTEVGDEDSYYEVEVKLDDGSQVDVQLDDGFNVVGGETELHGRPTRFGCSPEQRGEGSRSGQLTLASRRRRCCGLDAATKNGDRPGDRGRGRWWLSASYSPGCSVVSSVGRNRDGRSAGCRRRVRSVAAEAVDSRAADTSHGARSLSVVERWRRPRHAGEPKRMRLPSGSRTMNSSAPHGFLLRRSWKSTPASW